MLKLIVVNNNNRNFYHLGGLIVASASLKYIGFTITMNPHYDSTLKYHTCSDIETNIPLLENIDLCMSSGNIPQFRNNSKYCKVGLYFKSDRLEVKPEISFSCFGNRDYLKVYCSFRRILNLTKRKIFANRK